MEQPDKKHRQELEPLREEQELENSMRRRSELGKDKANASGKKMQPGVRQNTSASASNTSISTSNQLDATKGVDKRGSLKKHSGTVGSDKEEKRKQSKVSLMDACPAVLVLDSDPEQGETKIEALSDSKKNLALRFKIYEASQKDVAHILSFWDRAEGILLSPLNQAEVRHKAKARLSHRTQKNRGKEHQVTLEKECRKKERMEKERAKKERLEKECTKKERLEKKRTKKERLEKEHLKNLEALDDSALSELEGEGAEGSGRGQCGRVPCLTIEALGSEDVTRKILGSVKLPVAEQILDELGLGPSGPPIPPPALYSVIRYPEKRTAPAAGEALQHFRLVVPEGAVAEGEQAATTSEKQVTPTRGRSRKEKAVGSPEAPRKKRSSSRGSRELQRPDTGAPTCPPRLSSCRWTVPAHGEVQLQVHFSCTELGQFEQTLHFEILGTKRLYQLPCRGTCLYPAISQDPRLVFPHQRESKEDEDIISKQYVMDTGVFHFGPLLCGKPRDGYKELRYPSNCEKITILNVSPLEAEVHFSFERDLQESTFLLEPPSMRRQPNEKQELSVWAYPTSAGLVEDKLICCIQGNPEPVVFRLCCQGVQVELGVSPKELLFNTLLLPRKDNETLALQNRTPLPVAWQLIGLEGLGEDFSMSEDSGIVGPHTEFAVQLRFKATKALSVVKTIQLEVSDAENILGVVQTENIEISAEAGEPALSTSVSQDQLGQLPVSKNHQHGPCQPEEVREKHRVDLQALPNVQSQGQAAALLPAWWGVRRIPLRPHPPAQRPGTLHHQGRQHHHLRPPQKHQPVAHGLSGHSGAPGLDHQGP